MIHELARVSARDAGLPEHPTALEGHRSVIAAWGPWVFLPGFLTYEPQYGRQDSAKPFHRSGPQLHSEYVYSLIERALQQSGSSLEKVVYQTVFLRPEFAESGGTGSSIHDHLIHRRRRLVNPYASNDLLISDLYVRGSAVEIEVIAVRDHVETSAVEVDSPLFSDRPMGEAHATIANGWVFVAGEGPTDWRRQIANEAQNSLGLWSESPMELQLDYTLRKLAVILEAAGSSLEHVVHALVAVTDMRDLFIVDRVWRRYFAGNPPARTILPVLGLPGREWKVQVSAIAVTAGSGVKKEAVFADDVPDTDLHEPHAVKAGQMLFTSSIMAVDQFGRDSRSLPNLDYPDPAESAARQADVIFSHLAKICEAAGTSTRHIVRERNFHPSGMLHEQVLPYYRERARAIEVAPVGTGIGVGVPFAVPACTILSDAVAIIPEEQHASG